MPKWYTYVNLQELKDSSSGLKCFYGVVDEIEDRNEGCSHFRLWDYSNCTVIIKLMGSFIRTIDKGDVIRVHRLLRKDQNDLRGAIGFGEAGKTSQVVAWRRNEDGEGFTVIGSSSANYTRNEDEIKSVVEKLHDEWIKVVADEMRLSTGDMTGSTELDSFDNTVILREATGNATLDSFLDDTASEVITGRSSALDSFLDNTATQRDPERNSALDSFLDNTLIEGETSNNLFVADSHNEGDGESSQPFNECSLNVDSIVAEKRLNSLLDETMEDSMDVPSQEDSRSNQPNIPPPPLTQDQEMRLKKAACISDLKEEQYYDLVLQVVQAYYEEFPLEHVVMRCWDTQSTSIPSFTKPLRIYNVDEESLDREIFSPDKSLIEASHGCTVDIYCYDYNKHVGKDGSNIKAGDWLLFCSFKVKVLDNDIVLSMHQDGSAYGRCIIRIPPEFIPENEENNGQIVRSDSQPIQKNHGSEEESFIDRLNSFRNSNNDSSGVIENTKLIPRCKTIRPYLRWNRPIVPVNVIEDSSNIDLVNRVNCNCGAPLTKDESACADPERQTKRHKYFYRNKMSFVQMTEPSADKETMIPSEILPSISCIAQRGMPTVFDLVVQISHLSVEKQRVLMTTGIPPCHISVWDGTCPPVSIGNDRLLHNLTTRADKICVGQTPLLNLHTIDVRLAQPRKCTAGEFAILRDVIVVRAYDEVADDGSLLPVWMLHARDMTVIRTPPESIEEKTAFLSVAKSISNAILNVKERVEENEEHEIMEVKKGGVKRKTTSSGISKRSKMIRVEEETWISELIRKDQNGIQSQEESTYTLKSLLGSIEPPTATFHNFDINNRLFSNFVTYFEKSHNETSSHDPRRDVWLHWMKPCLTFNTIKDKREQVGCCPTPCGGEISQFVHIPIENPLNKEKLLHFLIDTSHFRANNTHLSFSKWRNSTSKIKEEDAKRIVAKLIESSIAVRRVNMMYLKSKVVFVVHKGNDWLTVSKR